MFLLAETAKADDITCSSSLCRAYMIDLLNYLGVEFVVLGNHEFDFGEATLQTLLKNAKFTAFGSNIRLRDSCALLGNTTDTQIILLANSLRLGMFGVCTVSTATDSFPSDNVVFESEIAHAKRCVEILKSQGADVIIALTHMVLQVDKLLAKHVPEIDLILGGHDHEPMSLFQGSTLIHKSGQDALWLGKVQIDIRKANSGVCDPLTFQWGMFPNQGYAPDPACSKILQLYADRVDQELTSRGQNEVLATSTTLLDGTRITCRSRESNLGNMIADAIRDEFQADIAIINGGYIRGERLHNAGLKITRAWLAEVLSHPNPTCVIEMRLGDLRAAMLKLFAKYPELNSSFPQTSGIFVVYDIRDDGDRSLRLYRDLNHTQELGLDSKVTVATSSFVLNEMPGFKEGHVLFENGCTIPDIVVRFLQQSQTIAYPLQEHRVTFLE